MEDMSAESRDAALSSAGKHYAAGYLLMSAAMGHIGMGDDELEKLGFNHREVKMLAGRVQKSFDVFHKAFDSKFLKKGTGAVVARDYDAISAEIDRIIDEKL